VRSAPGAGAQFAVFLPAHRGQPRPATPPPVETRSDVATILVVDDEPMILSLMSRSLTSLGYEVVTANGPAEAERIAASRDDIRLLITDVVMPGGNGPALAHRLKTRRPELKVMLMSGYAANLEPGDDTPLPSKPFTMDELETLVRELLG
jgi:two-component system cell cycle sensor histidine kinase/response regulator CckA